MLFEYTNCIRSLSTSQWKICTLVAYIQNIYIYASMTLFVKKRNISYSNEIM